MTAYYNEFDKDKAAWLRELIKAGVIAPGDVDERSIKDVRASDLVGYTQCHWFAGIGVWSYALRLAGWPDDREVWTGSCPCPGFSCAGKGGGFDDPRHLWPELARLVRECRPSVVFGEQVGNAIRFGWLDLVADDVEREGYEFASAVLTAASVGAPHIRERLYFVASLPEMRQIEASRFVLQEKERMQLLPPQAAQDTAEAQSCERASAMSRLQAEIPVENTVDARPQEGGEVRVGIRPRLAPARDAGEDYGDEMRDDGSSTRAGVGLRKSRQAVLEHGIAGPERLDSRLHPGQCPSGVLGDKRRYGYMGRRNTANPNEPVATGEELNAGQSISASNHLSDEIRASIEVEACRDGILSLHAQNWAGDDTGRSNGDEDVSAGAPHIRQRLYFCADTLRESGQRRAGSVLAAKEECCSERFTDGHMPVRPEYGEQVGVCGDTPQRGQSVCGSAPGNARHVAQPSALGVEIDAKCKGLEGHFGDVREWRGPGWLDALTARSIAETGATRGYWADCDWWYGRDEKYRPIGPGLFPLASRSAARVLQLRGYGDSIVAPVAQIFIQAYLESERDR